jgi:hypothetical protein
VRQDGKFQNPVPARVGGISLIFKIVPLYLTSKEEKEPLKSLGPFHTDARETLHKFCDRSLIA